MKWFLSFFITLTSILGAQSQQLNLKKLVELKNRNDEEINSFLTAKGWSFDGTYKTAHNNLTGGGRWIYKNKNFPMGSIASFTVATDNTSGKRQILYMTFVKASYDIVRGDIEHSMIKVYTNSAADCIEALYSDPLFDYSCRTGICKYKELAKPLYRITIL